MKDTVFCLCIVSGAIALGTLMTVDKTYLVGFQIVPMIAFSHVFYGLFYFNQMGMLFEKKTLIIRKNFAENSATSLPAPRGRGGHIFKADTFLQ